MNNFYRCIKLKAHFRDNNSVEEEAYIFKKPINERWALSKDHTIKTFIKTKTESKINSTMRRYVNLSKKKQSIRRKRHTTQERHCHNKH